MIPEESLDKKIRCKWLFIKWKLILSSLISEKLIYFTYNFFFPLQNMSTTSADLSFSHFASGKRWLQFSKANLPPFLSVPLLPHFQCIPLSNFLIAFSPQQDVFPLTHKHVLSFFLVTYSSNVSLPLISPRSFKGQCLQRMGGRRR